MDDDQFAAGPSARKLPRDVEGGAEVETAADQNKYVDTIRNPRVTSLP
jgi:hypothetical protein